MTALALRYRLPPPRGRNRTGELPDEMHALAFRYPPSVTSQRRLAPGESKARRRMNGGTGY